MLALSHCLLQVLPYAVYLSYKGKKREFWIAAVCKLGNR